MCVCSTCSFRQSMSYEIINLEYLKELKLRGNRRVIDFCISMKLIPSWFECPTCKLPMILYEQIEETDGFRWWCSLYRGKNDYSHSRSVTSGSWFDGTTSTVIDMLLCIYLWVTETKFKRISEELQNSVFTICQRFKKYRDVCVEIVAQENVILGGPGIIVEIYEAKFVKNISYRPRITGEWVYLVAERGTHKCFVQVKENTDITALLNILYQRVLPGTTIVSYGWNMYDCYYCYQHKIYLERNYNLTFMKGELGPDTGESFWTLIENSVYGCKTEYKFNSAVAEFMWRHFHEGDHRALLRSFLKNISCDRWQED